MAGRDDISRPFWRQPLLHFLLAGAAIFALDAVRGTPERTGDNRIVVSSAQVKRLADQWQLTWGRRPEEAELQGLVRNFIKEEIYYREALKLGLDVNDSVIRQRLGRKMEFLSVSELTADSVDEATLQSYYEANVVRYEQSPVFDFAQVYFERLNVNSDSESPNSTDGVETTSAAGRPVGAILQQLRTGAQPGSFGDSISLPGSMRGVDQVAITRTFGSEFFTALNTLELGDWTGPIKSGFGFQLVNITRKVPSRIPALPEVRGTVLNDWLAEQNSLLQAQAYEKIRSTYDVQIEVTSE